MAQRALKIYKPISDADFAMRPIYKALILYNNKLNYEELYEDVLECLDKFLKTTFEMLTYLDTPADKKLKNEVNINHKRIIEVWKIYEELENIRGIQKTENDYKQRLKDLINNIKEIYNFCSEVEYSKRDDLDHLNNLIL